jgi:hypothetical protein
MKKPPCVAYESANPTIRKVMSLSRAGLATFGADLAPLAQHVLGDHERGVIVELLGETVHPLPARQRRLRSFQPATPSLEA